jgi:coenzyme F420-reducing hydrogenase delta subunit
MTVRRIWKTRDGTKVTIREMATSHIQNCLRILHGVQEKRILEIGCSGSCLHGEMAIDAFERGYDDLLENGFDESDPIQEYIDTFECELLRRGEED